LATDPQAEKLAVLIKRELGVGVMIASVRVANESLAALAHPFHRPPHLGGGPGYDCFLRVVKLFNSKTATDVGSDDAQFVLGDVEHEVAHEQPHDMRKLASRPECIMFGGLIEFCDSCTRLHGIADETVVDEFDPRDMGGLPESGVGRS
jgi:hypothetical protein